MIYFLILSAFIIGMFSGWMMHFAQILCADLKRQSSVTKHGRRKSFSGRLAGIELTPVGGHQPMPHTRMPPPPMPVCKPANIPIDKPYPLGKERFICKHNCGKKIAIAGEPQVVCTRHNNGWICGLIVVNEEARRSEGINYAFMGATGFEE